MYKPIMHAKNTVISDVLGVLTDGEHMPENASFHMTPDEFRRHGKAMVDWIADYYERIESYPVLSQVKSGEIRASLPKNPPAQGEPFESLLGDVAQKIMPGVTHWQSPNFFANSSLPASTCKPCSGPPVPPARNSKRTSSIGSWTCSACPINSCPLARAEESSRTRHRALLCALCSRPASAPRTTPRTIAAATAISSPTRPRRRTPRSKKP